VPIDYYPQKSVEQLLELLEELQSRQAKGAITEVSAAGVRTVRSDPGGANADMAILRVLYSLHLKMPEVYANPYASRIRRTVPSYVSDYTHD